MVDTGLAESFESSIKNEITELISEGIETLIDSSMKEGIIKEIPFVGVAFKLYSIGNIIHDNHCLGKLLAFINSINNRKYSEQEREKHVKLFVANRLNREKELEYILVLINRYIGLEKPKILAQIYLSFLYLEISWIDLTKYAEIIDRCLPGDIEYLLCNGGYIEEIPPISDSLLRLVGLGLYEEKNPSYTVPITIFESSIIEKKTKMFEITSFGLTLHKILKEMYK